MLSHGHSGAHYLAHSLAHSAIQSLSHLLIQSFVIYLFLYIVHSDTYVQSINHFDASIYIFAINILGDTKITIYRSTSIHDYNTLYTLKLHNYILVTTASYMTNYTPIKDTSGNMMAYYRYGWAKL